MEGTEGNGGSGSAAAPPEQSNSELEASSGEVGDEPVAGAGGEPEAEVKKPAARKTAGSKRVRNKPSVRIAPRTSSTKIC